MRLQASIVVLGITLTGTLGGLAASARLDVPQKADAAGIEFFEKKIRPLLAENCFACHSTKAKVSQAKLFLDSREAIIKGGVSGTALVVNDPEQSRIITAVRYLNPGLQMPPSKKLSDTAIADLTAWVKMGAPWPAEAAKAPIVETPNPSTEKRLKNHWSFRPVKSYSPPSPKRKGWAIQPLDRFVLAKLESKGLAPGKPADRRTLIRRASYDMLGLPPSHEEVEAFVNDKAPNAWETVVDRLLANPHYGERWGRFWLDVARYGEDQAHTFEARQYPQGFRYRDWVTHALNTDMPYDKFVKAQIAADLLPEPDSKPNLAALGFFATGPVYYADLKMYDQFDDRIDTLSRGFLGLTVACARCHDHKFDPVTQKDYYALAGVFASSKYIEVPVESGNSSATGDRAVNIKKAQDEVDKFFGDHGPRIRKTMIGETAKYVVSTWKYKTRLKTEPKLTTEKFAESEKIIQAMLDRWINYLTNSDDNENPFLASWRKKVAQIAAMPAPLEEIQTIASEFQATLQALIAKRDQIESKKAPAGTALTAAEAKQYEQLAGPDGVVSIPVDALDPFLVGDPKARYATIMARLHRVKIGDYVHSLTDGPKSVNCPLLLRGNPETPSDEVPRRFLTVLGGEQSGPFQKGSGRLELAESVASPNNPLTARVMVNRIWQHHFGRGIVRTTSNFGLLGERPSHPELLDYLATQFVSNNWSIKALHKTILMSATFKLSSAAVAKNEAKDPENVYLWRSTRQRLDVEAWRDSLLLVTNKLDRKIGGPSQPLSSPNNVRRTYYASISRHDLDSMLRLFDFPDANVTSDNRTVTTVPLQQLFVLNSDFMVNQAKALATLLNAIPNSTDEIRIRRAYEILYQRQPSMRELELGLAYLTPQRTEAVSSESRPSKLSRWELYSQALLSANEFMYID